jgi:shikimate kinase
MLIFIVGYMCSGKTTFGKVLVDSLHYRFIDLDELIVNSTGKSIADYFKDFGESAFRDKERELLLQHLQDQDTVIATGGGAPCYSDNIDKMNQRGLTIFLDTPLDLITARISENIQERPVLKDIPADQLPGFISGHLKSRRGFYEKAKIIVQKPDTELVVKAVRSR